MAAREIGVIGAGLMGMALARKLTLDGHRVTVLERDEQIGGLATWHDFGDFKWDRFYHVILPSDRYLIEFIRDLGIESDLEWRRTYTGFFVERKLYSISSNLEFLRFPPLSLVSKIRLAWTILYGSRINDWRRLETVTVEDWLLRVSGRNTYDNFWKPLLLAKLGPSYARVSAVFIWSYIKRLFSARDASASAEHLGHVSGGYRQIFGTLRSAVEQGGGRIETGCAVGRVRALNKGGLEVMVDSEPRRFDKVVCTSPVSVLRQIAEPGLLQIAAVDSDVEYLGVVCVVLITETALVPYYVVNIADDEIPFTGLIGMSNVISPEHTAGQHVTYLPKYMLSTDDELRQSDEYFKERFLAGVTRMFPEFDLDKIVSIHVNRAIKVQPLQVIEYSRLVPSVETRHPDFFVLNTSQFVNATLNNNEVIGAVNRFYERHAHDLAA